MLWSALFGGGGAAQQQQQQLQQRQHHEFAQDKVRLRLLTRAIRKNASKCRKAEKLARDSLERMLAEGEYDRAGLYAEHSVQQKALSLRYLKLALKLEHLSDVADSNTQMKEMASEVTSLMGSANACGAGGVGDLTELECIMDEIHVDNRLIEQALGGVSSHEAPQPTQSELSPEARQLFDMCNDVLMVQDDRFNADLPDAPHSYESLPRVPSDSTLSISR